MLNWIVWNWTDDLYKIDLALNNLQRLICHKNQPTNQIFIKTIVFFSQIIRQKRVHYIPIQDSVILKYVSSPIFYVHFAQVSLFRL